jgi:hypothetical protein
VRCPPGHLLACDSGTLASHGAVPATERGMALRVSALPRKVLTLPPSSCQDSPLHSPAALGAGQKRVLFPPHRKHRGVD